MSFPGGEGGVPIARDGEMYCLKWHTYQSHLSSGLRSLFLEGEDAETDVTLTAEGRYIQCHKWLLSLCSPYFKKLFRANVNYRTANTIVIVNNDIKFRDLENLVHFMYNGEVKVATNDELQGFLKGGELLEIEGLVRCTDAAEEQKSRTTPPQPPKSSATSSADDRPGVGVLSAPPSSAAAAAASVQPGTSSSSNFKTSYSTGATISSAHSASNVSQLSAARGPSGMSGIKRARYAEQSVSESSLNTSSGTSNLNIKNTSTGSGLVGYSNRHDSELELGEARSGHMQSDPLAFDPNIDGAGNLDPLGNIGTDPLAVEGESVETDERMMHFEGIKTENPEVYINEGEEDEGDYDTSDQGENSGMGEGMYQSGGISVETGATVTGLNLPGPSSELNATGLSAKTQGTNKPKRSSTANPNKFSSVKPKKSTSTKPKKSPSARKIKQRNLPVPLPMRPDPAVVIERIFTTQLAVGNLKSVLGMYMIRSMDQYQCVHCGFIYETESLSQVKQHIIEKHYATLTRCFR